MSTLRSRRKKNHHYCYSEKVERKIYGDKHRQQESSNEGRTGKNPATDENCKEKHSWLRKQQIGNKCEPR